MMNLQSQRSSVPQSHRASAPNQFETPRLEVIQFGDFECLDCGRAVTTLKRFRERFEEQIRFSYKHFPRESIHSRAMQAAEAAECARAQGRFWRMHDQLMANQDMLELQYIYDYADEAGLNMARFDKDMDDEVYLPIVIENLREGLIQGLVRTPAFLVSGALVEGSGGLGSLYEATEVALSLARETA